MSLKHEQLCSRIIRDNFGPTAEKIHESLKWGPRTLSILSSTTNLPLGCLKKGLAVLVNFGIVSFEQGRTPSIAEYTIHSDKIILILRYPRYLELTEKKFGVISRILLASVLIKGRAQASKVIHDVWAQVKNGENTEFKGSVEDLRESFSQLITSQYLIRCPHPVNSLDKVPDLNIEESDTFQPPELPLRDLLNYVNGSTSSFILDSNVLWRVNFDRFHQDMRDQLMVSAMERRLEQEAGLLLQIILKLMYLRTEPWATHSNPIPFMEVKEEVERTSNNEELIQYLDQYIKLIEDDSSNFIRKQGEGSMASVYVNLATAVRRMTECAVENLVEHRFGSKAARIFRLVSSKKYIDQEQLQKLAMIPDKEAKHLTYRLLSENFLHMQELKKAGTPGPVKNFYLLHVNFNQVVNVVLGICYKAVHNTLARAEHEREEGLRLVEKHEKLSSLAQCMRDQGADEEQIKGLVDEWITPPERAQLQSMDSTLETLRMAELSVDENIFLLELYKYYEAAAAPKPK